MGRSGSLPVLGGGCPVVHSLLAVPLLMTAPGCRGALVRDGRTIVRPGCSREGLNAGGNCPLRRALLRCCQLLAGSPRVPGFPLGLLQVPDTRADLGDTLTDLASSTRWEQSVGMLQITVAAGESGPVVRLSGECDLSVTRQLSDALNAQIASGAQACIRDDQYPDARRRYPLASPG